MPALHRSASAARSCAPHLTFLFPPSLGKTTTAARAELISGWMARHFDAAVGEVAVAADYAELERRIRAREVTLAWAPPYVCAKVGHLARGVFRAVRGGSDTYRSVIVCRREQRLTLGELAGKRAAWVSVKSEAGYRLPRKLMERAGLDPDRALQAQRFVGSYAEAIRCVLEGESDIAGVFARTATREAVASSLEQSHGMRARRTLVPVAFSDPVPNDALLVVRDEREGGVALDTLRAAPSGSGSNLLLGVLDADRLVPATADDYAGLP
jgi:ABC-type phosphate/phosphonate transport system substrate-binding protein